MRRRGELRLFLRSIRAGWPTSDEKFAENLQVVRNVLTDPDASPREKLAACDVCLEIDARNLCCDQDDALLRHARGLGAVYQAAQQRQ